MTFLVREIPPESTHICFVLDGPEEHRSCKQLYNEKSYRHAEKHVSAGTYVAYAFAAVCGTSPDCHILQATQPLEVHVTKVGPE